MAVLDMEGVGPLESIYGPREFAEFVRDTRKNEIAILPRLITLDERPIAKGQRHGAVFSRRVLELQATCLCIVDATAGLRSTDPGWFDHVERVHNQITHGRTLSSEEGRRRGAMKAELSPGIVAHWRSMKGSRVYERVRKHWMDPTITAMEAIGTAPGVAGDLNAASRKTWDRIFGIRTGMKKKRAVKKAGKKR